MGGGRRAVGGGRRAAGGGRRAAGGGRMQASLFPGQYNGHASPVSYWTGHLFDAAAGLVCGEIRSGLTQALEHLPLDLHELGEPRLMSMGTALLLQLADQRGIFGTCCGYVQRAREGGDNSRGDWLTYV